MNKLKTNIKEILSNSMLGAAFTLWTAPIDSQKLKLPEIKKDTNNIFLSNLILGQKS